MFPDGKTTPADFALWLAEQVVVKISPKIRDMLRDAPTKVYDVVRQTPQGPTQQQVSLPQMLAELTDATRIESCLRSEGLKQGDALLKATLALTDELKKSRKLAREMALERDEE